MIGIACFEDILTHLNDGDRIVGIDPGKARIGIAISDPARNIATPLATLQRSTFSVFAKDLATLLYERNVRGIVVGLPRNMDGSQGKAAQSARALARNLVKYFPDYFISLYDERLSTAATLKIMNSAALSRRQQLESKDENAAAWMLQGALDWLKMRASTSSE